VVDEDVSHIEKSITKYSKYSLWASYSFKRKEIWDS